MTDLMLVLRRIGRVRGAKCDSLPSAGANLVEAVPKTVMSRHTVKYGLLGMTFVRKFMPQKSIKGCKILIDV